MKNTFASQLPLKACTCLGIIVFTSSLSACSRYAVTLNNNEVYSPPPLLQDFVVADEALDSCLDKTIEHRNITNASQLRNLDCAHNRIQSLAGLEQFSQLEKIDLAHNQIQDLAPLLQLEQLESLNLRGNPAADCDTVLELVAQDVQIVHPMHCTP